MKLEHLSDEEGLRAGTLQPGEMSKGRMQRGQRQALFSGAH